MKYLALMFVAYLIYRGFIEYLEYRERIQTLVAKDEVLEDFNKDI